MTKPLVFCYRDYEELKEKYEKLVMDHTRLKAENTNLQIRCRIAEATVKELKDEQRRSS